MSEGMPGEAQDRQRGYEEQMTRIMKTVANKAERQRWVMLAAGDGALVWIVCTFALDLFFGPLALPKLIGFGLAFAWLAVYSKFLVPFRITARCPSCSEIINVNRNWVCGWCSDEKAPLFMQPYVSAKVPLEPCGECHRQATAIECPHCHEHIVFNVAEYNGSGQYGEMRPGVATFL